MKTHIRSLLAPHWKLLALSLAASALLVVVNIALRGYLGACLDEVLQGAGSPARMALPALAGIALCIALSGAKACGAQLLGHRVRSAVYRNACRQLIAHSQDGLSLGELTSLLSNHVTELVQAVYRFVYKVSGDVCCYVFAAVAIALIHPAVAAIAVCASILPTFFIRPLSRREQQERGQFMQETVRVNQAAAVGLYSMESVKANAMEDDFCASYGGALAALYRRRKALTKTETLLTIPSMLCAFGMQLALLVAGGCFAALGQITAGGLVTLITLTSYIVDPVMCLENSVVALHALRVSLESLGPYLTDAPCAPAADRVPLSDSVVFEGVSFAYPGGQDVLHALSFSLSPGKIHVLRGANGAGKSTLVRLLCGALRPQQGRILVLGHDASGLQPCDYESMIAVMPQENVLFAGTVLENLLLCRPEATRAQAAEACRWAGIHEEIMALESGYDTPLPENGGVLSGGQRQRLAFARTLLRDAPVMIFDEPSAALDDAHAAQMRAVLETLSRERVVLLITHDLRMLRDGDGVLALGGRA